MSLGYLKLNKWKKRYVPPGTVLDFGFLTLCTAFIAHRKSEKDAYAGHFPCPKTGYLDEMIEAAIRRFGKNDLMDIYVTGNSLVSEKCYERATRPYLIEGKNVPKIDKLWEIQLENREYVLDLIKKYKFDDKGVLVRWGPPFSNSQMFFSVDTGRSRLITRSDEGEIIYRGDMREAPEFEDHVVLETLKHV